MMAPKRDELGLWVGGVVVGGLLGGLVMALVAALRDGSPATRDSVTAVATVVGAIATAFAAGAAWRAASGSQAAADQARHAAERAEQSLAEHRQLTATWRLEGVIEGDRVVFYLAVSGDEERDLTVESLAWARVERGHLVSIEPPGELLVPAQQEARVRFASMEKALFDRTHPNDSTQAAFMITARDGAYPSMLWGSDGGFNFHLAADPDWPGEYGAWQPADRVLARLRRNGLNPVPIGS